MNTDVQGDTRTVQELAQAAKRVAPQLAELPTAEKNTVLRAAAESLVARTAEILEANGADIAAGREAGMEESLIDRLALDADRVAGIADGLVQVASLPDPVGDVVQGRTLPNGLKLRQVRVPLGVMGMVYEARPNVTVDAFGLALKSGNVALLRGSKSAVHSNAALPCTYGHDTRDPDDRALAGRVQAVHFRRAPRHVAERRARARRRGVGRNGAQKAL